jgi:hypothetical protein
MNSHKQHLALLSVVTAIVFWFAETAIHTWIFQTGTFTESLMPQESNEIWMRTLAVALTIAFGLYAQSVATAIRAAAAREQALNAELQDALGHLLSGYIPICAGCKAIRDDDKWVRIEKYITKRTGVAFSHGLCPSCLEKIKAEVGNLPEDGKK